MKHSTERILTTHCGSLARPHDLLELMRAKEHGQPYDREGFAGRVRNAVADSVRHTPLKDIVDLVLRVHAGAYSFEAANPRHAHEWHVWEHVKLPDGKVLIPGMISHASNIVEHPELIAERLVNYARLVGRENVIAGSDCGFSSQATFTPEVHPTVVWAKFQAMAEGARLATLQLWGRR